MPKLAVFRGRVFQYNYFLEKELTVIGRSTKADVPLDSEAVSRKHMVIVRRGHIWVAQDIGSANAETINGRPIDFQHVLRHGDRIEIAQHMLVFHDRSARQISDGLSRRDVPELTRTDMERKLDRTAKKQTLVRQQINNNESTNALSDRERDRMRAILAKRRAAHIAFVGENGRVEVPIDKDVLLVGYSDDCEVRLPGTNLFTSHVARIEKRGDDYVVVAMSRLKPVRVNGEKIDTKPLTNGITFTVGDVELRFRGKMR